MLVKIITLAGMIKSYEGASAALEVAAELTISARHINRLTEEVGQEMQAKRDEATENYVHHRRDEPTVPAPAAVALAVDGGKVRTREPGQGVGVHNPGWKEDKVGCFHELTGPTFDHDPHPEPPRCFLDPPEVDKLVRDLQAHHGPRQEGELPQLEELRLGREIPSQTAVADTAALAATDSSEAPTDSDKKERVPWPPKRSKRTCVATMSECGEFAKMAAAEAYQRNFHAAGRRAFLGDGSFWIWNMHAKWFADWTAIADFVHPLTYLYVTATVLAADVAQRWQCYVDWMTKCWQGRVGEVIQELAERLERLGPYLGEGDAPPTSPHAVLQRTLTYLRNNEPRMNYPAYRQQGLPVTSSAVESLIKEFNQRVKGTEKFWDRPEGAERILQIRAGVLSDDDRLQKHIKARAGSPFRRYRAKTRKAA
jgi:hypothetical protein